MSEDKKPDAAADTKQMTAADAAKRVKRPTTVLVDGKGEDGKAVKVPKIRHVGVRADEVLSFADHGTHVIVVTKDGQKLSSAADTSDGRHADGHSACSEVLLHC